MLIEKQDKDTVSRIQRQSFAPNVCYFGIIGKELV